MISLANKLLAKLESIPETKLLLINAGLAALVGLAHGGALAVSLSKQTHDAESIRQLVSISLPIALIVLVSAAIAWWSTEKRLGVLRIHGFVLAASAFAMFLWALKILISGIPEGNFSWGVGILSAWVCYSAFVFCRYSVSPQRRSEPKIHFGPVIALAVAVPVDVGVFVRAMATFGSGISG